MATVSCTVNYYENGGGAFGNQYKSNNAISSQARNTTTVPWDSVNLTALNFEARTAVGPNTLFGELGTSITTTSTITISYGSASQSFTSQKITSSVVNGDGNHYLPFNWFNGANATGFTGRITNSTLLNAFKNNQSITFTFSFSANSSYRILKNAKITITSYEYNTAPEKPTINYPVASTTTYNTKPRFSISSTDSDGSNLTYQYRADNGTSWVSFASSVASGTTKVGQATNALSYGAHTLYFRSYDGAAYSPEASVSINIANPTIITAGDSISANDIINAIAYLTNMGKYYNKTFTYTIPTKGNSVTNTSINTLNTNLKSLPPAKSFTVPAQGETINAVTMTAFINALKES